MKDLNKIIKKLLDKILKSYYKITQLEIGEKQDEK